MKRRGFFATLFAPIAVKAIPPEQPRQRLYRFEVLDHRSRKHLLVSPLAYWISEDGIYEYGPDGFKKVNDLVGLQREDYVPREVSNAH